MLGQSGAALAADGNGDGTVNSTDYDLWRDFPYEYVFDRLAIDVINGGPGLRDWVDDAAATSADLDAIATPDERAWEDQRRRFLLY